MKLPDFIIIGAMKSATSTLHEQLKAQDGIFMTDPKEPCFFSDDDIFTKGVDWYSSLFEQSAENTICGESSTHYTKLPTLPNTTNRIKQLLPDVKLIYVLRHPIDRMLSQYVHQWTMNEIKFPVNDAILKHKELIDYSRYFYQLNPYLEAFGPEKILLVFSERIREAPQAELERICAFLGYKHSPTWQKDLQNQNISNERLRRNKFRDCIINLPVLKQIRKTFVPQHTRNWIKSYWQISQTPALNEESISNLQEIFDKDLAALCEHLTHKFSCSNFLEVVSKNTIEWK